MATIQGVTKYQASVDASPSNVGNREVFVIERKDGVDRLVSKVTSDGSGNYTINNLSAKDRDIYTVTIDDFGVPWEANMDLIPGDRVHPSGTFAGYVYEVTAAGNTGTTEPTWWLTHGQSGTIGAAVADAFEFAQPEAHGPFFLAAEVNMDNTIQDHSPAVYYNFTEPGGSFPHEGVDSSFLDPATGNQTDKNGILFLSSVVTIGGVYAVASFWGDTEDFAVLIFIDTTSTGFFGEFISHGGRIRLTLESTGELSARMHGDSGFHDLSGPAINDGAPHTVLFKREGVALKLFLDGVEVDAASVTINEALVNTSSPFAINSNFQNGGLGLLALFPKTTISDADCVKIHEAIFGEFDLLNT